MESVFLNIENLTRVMTGVEATDWMLPLFWSLARKYPKCQVGEIGMRGGTSTLAFLLGVKESGGHVWSMDIQDRQDTVQCIRDLGFGDYHTFTCGDSTQTDFPEGAYFDVLFIDGSHREADVHADYHRHVERLKDGGVVLFHDTRSCPGVYSVVRSIGGWDIPLGAGLGIRTFQARNFDEGHQS